MGQHARQLLYINPPGGDIALPRQIEARGWDVHVAQDTHEAQRLIDRGNDYRVGLAHYDDLGHDSVRMAAEELVTRDRTLSWVVLLPQNPLELAVTSRRFISDFFYDYHTLPVDLDRFLATLGHAYGMAQLAREQCEAPLKPGEHPMMGRSPPMQEVFRKIGKMAESSLTVLISGESGTGKELAAQALHRLSQRSGGPFVAVNCGALPKELIQTELFGHERGAFTGADKRRVGRIEAAQGGTLFLDEIGDLPFDLQVNLLRFLQERKIDRVGGGDPISVDVRVVAATNVNLEKAVADGRFREDLYYRLGVLQLHMPPLRDRGDDIDLLANHFFQTFAQGTKSSLKGFGRQTLNIMRAYPWPGNVRELINCIQRADVTADGQLIRPEDLGLEWRASGSWLPYPGLMPLADVRAAAEREAIVATLQSTRNNVSRTAAVLEISRVTLYRLMTLHGIDWQRGKLRDPGGTPTALR